MAGKNKEQGYILPEVLLAVVILMSALTPLAGMYLVATQNSASSINRTTAVFLAQAKMEELKAAWHLNQTLSGEPSNDTKTLNGVTFRREFNAQNYNLNSLDLLHVSVVVSWDGQGQDHRVTLATYFNK